MSDLRIELLLFGPTVEAAGVRRVELRFPSGSTTDDLWTQLAAQHPLVSAALSPWRSRAALARNEALVRAVQPLVDGDTLALLPPVSGG